MGRYKIGDIVKIGGALLKVDKVDRDYDSCLNCFFHSKGGCLKTEYYNRVLGNCEAYTIYRLVNDTDVPGMIESALCNLDYCPYYRDDKLCSSEKSCPINLVESLIKRTDG